MRIVSKQLRDSARDESCTLRLIGCLPGNDTVVLCHAPGTGMKGTGMKSPDHFAMYGCQNCHDIIDGRKGFRMTKTLNSNSGQFWDYSDIVRAVCETQMRMIEKGLIKITGVKL